MNKFRYRLYQFMQGRRGVDQFSSFLMMTSALLLLITMFWSNNLTYALGIALCLYGTYRAFSRNIYQRERENNWFLAKKHKVIGERTFGRAKGSSRGFGKNGYGNGGVHYDMQNYIYFQCPSCGQKMRAPRGKGKIKVKCHHCGTRFEKKV